jgi:hypothetical protein
MGIIGLHLHTNIGSSLDSLSAITGLAVPIQDSNFTSIPSQKAYVNIKLDTAQLYISGIVFHNANGTSTAVSGKYILKYIAAEGPYIVGSVPTGNYTSVSFNVGLDGTANSSSPGTYSSINQVFPGSATTAGINFNVFNPPATFTNSVGESGGIAPMWTGSWSAATGYYFLNMTGYADTSAQQTGQYAHFSYQLSNTVVNVNMPTQTVANAGQTAVVVTSNSTYSTPAEMHIICDYGQVMKGITSFKPPYNTTANASTAAAIRTGVANMFHYEH